MVPIYSDDFYESLAGLEPSLRDGLVAEVGRRTRHIETYELLLIAFGPVGIASLYLKDFAGFATRICLCLSTAVLLVTALVLLDEMVATAALLFAVVAIGLWVADLVGKSRRLRRYHATLESRVLAYLRPS